MLGGSPGEGKWQPTPVFLPGEFHGQRSLAGYSPWIEESWTRLSGFLSCNVTLTDFEPVLLFHLKDAESNPQEGEELTRSAEQGWWSQAQAVLLGTPMFPKMPLLPSGPKNLSISWTQSTESSPHQHPVGSLRGHDQTSPLSSRVHRVTG